MCQASSACGIRFDPFSLMVRHNLGNALASLGHGTAVWVLKWTPTADNEGYSFDPSVIFFLKYVYIDIWNVRRYTYMYYF